MSPIDHEVGKKFNFFTSHFNVSQPLNQNKKLIKLQQKHNNPNHLYDIIFVNVPMSISVIQMNTVATELKVINQAFGSSHPFNK